MSEKMSNVEALEKRLETLNARKKATLARIESEKLKLETLIQQIEKLQNQVYTTAATDAGVALDQFIEFMGALKASDLSISDLLHSFHEEVQEIPKVSGAEVLSEIPPYIQDQTSQTGLVDFNG